MKVICIDANDRRGVPTPAYLKEGNEYDVADCSCGCGKYMLLDYDCNAADKDRFIPVSEIDETEFKRNYQTQTA